jgi:GT2 family glycosyltransferase
MNISIIVISKNEEKLEGTLGSLRDQVRTDKIESFHEVEVIVVDASQGRLAHIERDHPEVTWIDYTPPDDVRISIPHQRNVGIRAARGEIVVFTDSGCMPEDEWLARLVAPLVEGGERMSCGSTWVGDNAYSPEIGAPDPEYLEEAATINLAFTSDVIGEVGEFDESFEYGSDVDFTRRVVASGTRIRYVPEAVVVHDWGDFRRQLKRSVQYGAARIRLYRKHSERWVDIRAMPAVPVLYGVYLLGLPLAVRYRSYLLLLLIPLWRARRRPFPARVVVCHLAEGAGGLRELGRTAI